MKKSSLLLLPFFLIACGGEESTDELTDAVDEVVEEVEEVVENEEKKIASPRMQVEDEMNGVTVSIDYGSPKVKERVIWGELVPFDEVWRAGANAATAITFGSDAIFGGENVASGTYALFITPHEEGEWDVILNEEWSQEEHGVWGAYDYKEDKNVLKLDVSPNWSEDNVEEMGFSFKDGNLIFEWEKASFEISIASAVPA
ncbi:MAG: hypothetical protein BM555_06160 [Crocinitomix sp. MedPE-SWsnd]|jgi:Protein of unknown function (DUF2911)|nr:MAG: hypothetical protein BM555_06160 [Crocinitomix sp. MedPE-SWsnd]